MLVHLNSLTAKKSLTSSYFSSEFGIISLKNSTLVAGGYSESTNSLQMSCVLISAEAIISLSPLLLKKASFPLVGSAD